MNKKKMLALLAAATMLLGTVPVSAATSTVLTSGGSSSVETGGTVNGVNMDAKYRVTLPTGNVLGFTVDPYNLINLGTTGSATVDTSTGMGAIIAASGSGAFIKNESSVPVKVTAKFTITDTKNHVKLVTNEAAVTTTDSAMFLAAIPSKVKTVAVASYEAASTVVAITSGSSVEFKLNKAEYKIEKDGNGFKMVLASGAANYDATTFRLGGKVNKIGEWDQYTTSNDFKVKVVFEFKAEDASAVQVRTDAYGLVSGQANIVTGYKPIVPGENVTYEEAQGDYYAGTGVYVGTPGDDYAVAFTDHEDIVGVELNGDEADYTVTNGYVVIADTELASGTNTIVVEMEDGTLYKATVVIYTEAQGDYYAGTGVYVGTPNGAYAAAFTNYEDIVGVELNGDEADYTVTNGYVVIADAKLASGTNTVVVEMEDGTVYKATFTK